MRRPSCNRRCLLPRDNFDRSVLRAHGRRRTVDLGAATLGSGQSVGANRLVVTRIARTQADCRRLGARLGRSIVFDQTAVRTLSAPRGL